METEETARSAITGEPDPMPAIAHLEFVVHPPLVNVRVMRTSKGDVCGIAQIQTQRGPITFTATANEAAVRRAVMRACAHAAKRKGLAMAQATGALGDWAHDIATKVAKARVINKLVDQAKEVAKNPQIARAVGLSTVVIPGTGSAVIALQSASELLQGLRRKDPRAIQAWRTIQTQARLGNVKARKSVHIVHAVAHAPRIVSHH